MSIEIIDDIENELDGNDDSEEYDNSIPYEPINDNLSNEPEDKLIVRNKKNIVRHNISDFDDAIVNGELLVKENDIVVIEHHSKLISKNKNYWLHTSIYSIVKIFENGDIRLWNEQLNNFAYTNYKTIHLSGDIMKIPTKKFLKSNLKKEKNE